MYKDDLQAKDVYSGSSIFNPANQIKSFLFDPFDLSNLPDLLYFPFTFSELFITKLLRTY